MQPYFKLSWLRAQYICVGLWRTDLLLVNLISSLKSMAATSSAAWRSPLIETQLLYCALCLTFRRRASYI